MAKKEHATDEYAVRLATLKALLKKGINPYPSSALRTHTLSELKQGAKKATVVGRVKTIRSHGGSTFAHIEDGTAAFQIYCKQDKLSEDSYKLFTESVGLGDFIQVSGTLFTTKRGEDTVLVSDWKFLAKALRPLPEKWHGLQDVEARFRKRYLDLIMNKESVRRMRERSAIIESIRDTMKKNGFLEVETPTLQPVYGGGFARPFVTHHNTLDADFYLRISDEMYLKRLLVGGIERVYEITKVFRNEGMDRDHNPEFTMFEAQAAYQDYRWGMDIFEEIFSNAATSVLRTTKITHGRLTVDVKRPWKRMTVLESLEKVAGLKASSWKTAAGAAKDLQAHVKDKAKIGELKKLKTVGALMGFAFEELVEEKLIQPTITYDYPVEVSPLAKKSSDPRFTERFEAFALGSELGNNYSELNDPVDLKQRFVEEKKKAESGFEEAHQTDLDYLEAIEHGMPPACGLGIGIDRMVMLLTGAENIREVILFPTLRPKDKEKQ